VNKEATSYLKSKGEVGLKHREGGRKGKPRRKKTGIKTLTPSNTTVKNRKGGGKRKGRGKDKHAVLRKKQAAPKKIKPITMPKGRNRKNGEGKKKGRKNLGNPGETPKFWDDP